jgi:hypothetical protein
MKTWWLVLKSRSSRDSAAAGWEQRYQSDGDLFEERVSDLPGRPARSASSLYRSSAWAEVNSRIAKSSTYPDPMIIPAGSPWAVVAAHSRMI